MTIKRYGRYWAVYDASGRPGLYLPLQEGCARSGEASDQPGASTR